MSKTQINNVLEDALALTEETFIQLVETYVHRDSLEYTEAIMHVCEQHLLEPEDIAVLITGPLKEKLKLEAQNKNLLPGKTGTTQLCL